MACFIAGTMVFTAAGFVAIEKIKAGDVVISTNPDMLETDEKPVLETYVRKVDKLVHLTINGEEIVTTIDHPFYVQGRGFINAGNLLVGDTLVSVNGEDLIVDDCYIEECYFPTTVYNFQVEDYHTYFVDENKIWVHNADYKNANIQSFTIKDKHLSNSTAKRARKFNASTPNDANKIVQDAIDNGKLYSVTDNGIGSQGQNSYSIIINAGKTIGTKGETFIKLVFDDYNNVWTTYPIPDP